MDISISSEAVNWYKDALELEKDAYVRFFVRYGGVGGQLPGFSLGVSVEEPFEQHVLVTKENIHFYIEEADVWYFEEKDLHIGYDEKMEEPSITYES